MNTEIKNKTVPLTMEQQAGRDYEYAQATAMLFAFRCSIESMEESVRRQIAENNDDADCELAADGELKCLLDAMMQFGQTFEKMEVNLLSMWNN
jgi:hypothetical protein